jgi:hypothetical protein
MRVDVCTGAGRFPEKHHCRAFVEVESLMDRPGVGRTADRQWDLRLPESRGFGVTATHDARYAPSLPGSRGRSV